MEVGFVGELYKDELELPELVDVATGPVEVKQDPYAV